MKIYIPLTFVLGTILISTPVFAAGSCAIESTLSKELTTYRSDLESTLSKLEDASSKGKCGTDGTTSTSLARATTSIKQGVNLGLSQDCYLSSAAFTIEL